MRLGVCAPKQLLLLGLLVFLAATEALAAQSIRATVYGIPSTATRLVGLLDGGEIASPTPFVKNFSTGTASTVIDIGTIAGGPYRLRILAQDSGANLLSSGKVTGINVYSGSTVNVTPTLSSVMVSVNGATPTSAPAGAVSTMLFDIYDAGDVVRPVASSCWVDWSTDAASLSNRKFGNLSNVSGANYQCSVAVAAPGNAPLLYYRFGTYAYEFAYDGVTPILLSPSGAPHTLSLAAASTISLSVSDIPLTATRLVVNVDGGGLTAASVSAQTVSAGTPSALVPLGVPVGGPYRMRVLAHDSSQQLLRTGSATGVTTSSGGSAAVEVALADVSATVASSTPAVATYGSALAVAMEFVDTGLAFRTGDAQCWMDYGTVAAALTSRRYGSITSTGGSQFKCSVSMTATATGTVLYYRMSAYAFDLQYERITPLLTWPGDSPQTIALAPAGAISLTISGIPSSTTRLVVAVDGGELSAPSLTSISVTPGTATTSTTLNIAAGGPYRVRVVTHAASGEVASSGKATGVTVSGGGTTAVNLTLSSLTVALDPVTPAVAAPGTNVAFVFNLVDSGDVLRAGARYCWVNYGESAAGLLNRAFGTLAAAGGTAYQCTVPLTLPNNAPDMYYQFQTSLTDFVLDGVTPSIVWPSGGPLQLATHTAVTVTTTPEGLAITVDGVDYTSPQTFAWVPGSTHSIATDTQSTSDTRYLYQSWSDSGTLSHTVTALETAQTFTAYFNVKYKFTLVVDPPEAGSIATNVPLDEGYISGSVDITATANPGYQFESWSGDTVGTGNPETTLVDRPRTVTAHFSGPPGVTVTTNPPGLVITVDGVGYTSPRTFAWVPGSTHTIATETQSTSDVRHAYQNWSDGGAVSHTVTTPATVQTITAYFNVKYKFTLVADPPEAGSISTHVPLDEGYVAGWVGITATANPGYQFQSWSGDTTSTRNPEATLVDRPRTVTAHFSGPPGVTVTTNPPGLVITVDGVGYTSPRTFAWVPGSTHAIATATQSTASTRYLYQNWSDGGAASHTVTTPVIAQTITAYFNVKYKFTLVVDPPEAGSISTHVPLDEGYIAGWVGITATANPGYQFQSWSGDTTSTRNPEATLVDRPRTVTAHFSGPPGVTVTTNPPGLAITVDGVGYTSPRTFAWAPGSTHSIATATQSTPSARYLYQNWSDGGAASHTVTTPATVQTITAYFNVKYKFTLVVDLPEAGSISTHVPLDEGCIAGWVGITATANPGYQFQSWSGDTTSTRNPEATLVDRPRTVTAHFSGPPGVTVTTNPPGLAITVDGVGYSSPRTFAWVPGSTHTIATATQNTASVRYLYQNWSDGGAASHTVTALATAQTITAYFNVKYKFTLVVDPPEAGSIATNVPLDEGYVAGWIGITATANPGYQFQSWSGDTTSTRNPEATLLSAPRTVTAHFVAVSGLQQAAPPLADLRLGRRQFEQFLTISRQLDPDAGIPQHPSGEHSVGLAGEQPRQTIGCLARNPGDVDHAPRRAAAAAHHHYRAVSSRVELPPPVPVHVGRLRHAAELEVLVDPIGGLQPLHGIESLAVLLDVGLRKRPRIA
jgi:hypothetical protein